MNKLSRLFVRRLERIARREARRNAHINGLLDVKIVEIGGHVLRRYVPAFDTTRFSGNPERDLAWLRRNFGGYLMPPPPASDIVVTETKPLASILPFLLPPKQAASYQPALDMDHARRAYAVGLVGRAGRPPLVSNIVAALVLSRAIENSRMPFSRIARAAVMTAPVVSLQAPIAGFEQAMRRLIETQGFIPGGALNGIDGEYVFDDGVFDGSAQSSRIYVQFMGQSVHRLTASALQRRLVNALTRDYPVVAIAERADQIPSDINIAADIDLTSGWLDYPFISAMIETVHGASGLEALQQWVKAYDAHYLTIDDVVLAFRPGRSAGEVIAVLASLTERNRIAARDGDDDDDETSSGHEKKASKSKDSTGSDKANENGGKWKRDKPSGAEVIQPQPRESGEGDRPALAVETPSGYGKASTWALDLKADLVDYLAGTLAWSDMSVKLLLSGPPGTGKTTFAKGAV
ncbi:hypothetical protein RMR16_013585 [Agrobacterium sp. rho-13.3]|uniref:hypothetical protein n=1 Tax=Agrobacterium sp. rho-13.3 TaxID=3072980 RepID=UPI002A0AC2A1|nr:hypothetical protein [Agrobacterium sp. rho-13.3]MDX8309903.1 hypothetical protein [Agrobacterium sp. rho-13.3]